MCLSDLQAKSTQPGTAVDPQRFGTRLSERDESLVALKTLMTDTWGLEPPEVIISVTGGAATLSLKEKQKLVLRSGLLSAAQRTRAWITTGGTRSGIMEEVRRANPAARRDLDARPVLAKSRGHADSPSRPAQVGRMVAGKEGRQQPVIGIVPWRGVQGAPELEKKAVERGNGLVCEYIEKTGARPPAA